MVRLNALAVACFLSIGSIALAAPPPPVPSQAAAPLVSVLIASDEASTKIETSAIAKSIVVTSPPAPPNGATPAKKLHADLVFDTSKERIDVRKRVELLQAQADALGLPLRQIPIPFPCPNGAYEQAMAAAVRRAVEEGFTHIAFGDLFLEDIRRYRETQLAGSGLTPVFPLFGLDTTTLAHAMVAGGLRARLTCVDPKVLDPRFVGREFDAALLDELPTAVDPCGERGEFHTFAYDGPMFARPIPVESGEVVEREGFVFADLT